MDCLTVAPWGRQSCRRAGFHAGFSAAYEASRNAGSPPGLAAPHSSIAATKTKRRSAFPYDVSCSQEQTSQERKRHERFYYEISERTSRDTVRLRPAGFPWNALAQPLEWHERLP